MKPKLKNIKFIGKAAYIEDENILVFGDVHIGYEEALNKQGIFVPLMQFKQTIDDLNYIFSEINKIDKIVILGDLKHEFGVISHQEWNETLKFLDELEKHCNEIILIKGNHDTILGPIADKRKIKVVQNYKKGKYFFIHGDKPMIEMYDKDIEYIFAGHVHPAVSLREDVKVEKYKCFLVGKEKNKIVIVLPSFMPSIEGSDLMQSRLKLFNEIDLSKYYVFALSDDQKNIYELGKLEDI